MEEYMKFEKLSEYKLKITLSNDELPNSNGDLDSFMSNPNKARQSFLDILNKAENEVGFHIGNNKVRIDAKYQYNGNFVFTVTKLIPKKKIPKKAKPQKVSTNRKQNCLIYSFDDIENFFNLCNFLKVQKINCLKNFSKITELYKLDDKYYLIFNEINNEYKYIGKIYSCITEFGNFFSMQELMTSMLKERGTLIIKNNAIQICQKNFYNDKK